MKTVLTLICGVVLGSLVMWAWERHELGLVMAAQQAQEKSKTAEIAALQEDMKTLKGIMPTQSHVMADISTQFGNLWFAAQKKNWTQAAYFYNETRGRMRWAVRINPKPKIAGSEEYADIQGIFDGIDQGVLPNLKKAIDKKDSAEFVAMYKQTIEACYSCHKSIGRPFLRPMIPTVTPQPTLNYDPNADWPS